MDLGTFSVSLAVRDLDGSRAFYEKLGFTPFFGEAAQGWLILKNGDVAIGLFQGMFERNILTFNPGWDGNAQPLDTFTDVRQLQRELRAKGAKSRSPRTRAPRVQRASSPSTGREPGAGRPARLRRRRRPWTDVHARVDVRP